MHLVVDEQGALGVTVRELARPAARPFGGCLSLMLAPRPRFKWMERHGVPLARHETMSKDLRLNARNAEILMGTAVES